MKVNVNFTDKTIVIIFLILCVMLVLVGEFMKVEVMKPCDLAEERRENYIKVCGEAKVYAYSRYSRIVFFGNGSRCLEGVVFSKVDAGNMDVVCICAEGEVSYDGEMIIKKLYPCEGNP